MANKLDRPHEYKDDPHDGSEDELVRLGCAIFREADCLGKFKISAKSMDDFLHRVYRHHKDNPYHNRYHAFHVLLNYYRMLRPLFGKLPKLEVLTVLVGALCHDLEHEGIGNAILLQRKHRLAERFKESYLENQSLLYAFHLLGIERLDELEDEEEKSDAPPIFAGLSQEQKAQAQEIMRDLIITTDLGNKEASAKMKEQWAANCVDQATFEATQKGPENTARAARICVYRTLLLCADIGIVCERFDIYSAWVIRLFDEMKQQDPSLELPGYYTGQGKFLQFYARPLFDLVLKAQIVPNFNFYGDRLVANEAIMKKHNEAGAKTHLVPGLY